MNTKVAYSLALKQLKRDYKRISISLRRTKMTKRACEDAGYLMFYPHILSNISELSDNKSIMRKDIRLYNKLLKKVLKNEK